MLLPVLGAGVSYIYYCYKERQIQQRIQYKRWIELIGILLVFIAIATYQNYIINDAGFIAIDPEIDVARYANNAQSLNTFGIEKYNDELTAKSKASDLYHYFESWMVSLFSRISGYNELHLCNILYYPIMLLLLYWVLFEYVFTYVENKPIARILGLFGIMACGFPLVKILETKYLFGQLQLSIPYVFFYGQSFKTIPIAVCFIIMMRLIHERRYRIGLLFGLFTLPFLLPTIIPSVYGAGILLILLYVYLEPNVGVDRNKKIIPQLIGIYAASLVTMFVVITTKEKYFFTWGWNSFGLQAFAKYAINSAVVNSFQVLTASAIPILFIGTKLRELIKEKSNLHAVLLVISAFVFFGIVGASLMVGYVNNFQMFSNAFNAAFPLLCIVSILLFMKNMHLIQKYIFSIACFVVVSTYAYLTVTGATENRIGSSDFQYVITSNKSSRNRYSFGISVNDKMLLNASVFNQHTWFLRPNNVDIYSTRRFTQTAINTWDIDTLLNPISPALYKKSWAYNNLEPAYRNIDSLSAIIRLLNPDYLILEGEYKYLLNNLDAYTSYTVHSKKNFIRVELK